MMFLRSPLGSVNTYVLNVGLVDKLNTISAVWCGC